MANITTTHEAFEQILKLGSQGSGLDVTYDQLRLLGAVIGYITLLQTAAYGADSKDRVSAAKTLVDLKEEPEAIVERLRAAPFHDLTIKQIEYVIEEMERGRTDLSNLYDEAREVRSG